MEVIELPSEMQTISERLRREGRRIRLVPTMGALHAGHASLVQLANGDSNNREQSSVGGDRDGPVVVIVSIFTNPLQFNSAHDYHNYPETRQWDLEQCGRLGVRYVFAPQLVHMYPAYELHQGGGSNKTTTTTVMPPPGAMADELEGKSRAGHFQGMLTVVCKLFNIIRPHEAYFGEKDYQQLVLVERMVRDLNMDIRIRPGATVRDPDLLPLSSRNVRLSPEQRRQAPIMTKILLEARHALEAELNHSSGQQHDLSAFLMGSMLSTMLLNLSADQYKLVEVDYLELRCAHDVSEISYSLDAGAFDCAFGCAQQSGGFVSLKARLLISVIIGQVRLLDNIEVNLKTKTTTSKRNE